MYIMKFICLLFCIYVLYLVSLPCKDGGSCSNGFYTEQTAPHHHPAEQDHADGCSPFCTCCCCNVTVVLTTFYFEPAPSFLPVEINFLLEERQSTAYPHLIWEPPKLKLI